MYKIVELSDKVAHAGEMLIDHDVTYCGIPFEEKEVNVGYSSNRDFIGCVECKRLMLLDSKKRKHEAYIRLGLKECKDNG